jgi:Ca-activated chloride channel family protein
MILRYPWLLLLLLLAPALVYLRYARKRRAALRFSDGSALAHLPRSWAVVLQPLLPVLYALGLVLLIIAMTRPQAGLGESRVRTDGVDMILLVDVSPSMAAEDFSTATKSMNRLDAAKQVIERFVEKRRGDRIGLVAFAALPFPLSPLTLDHGWLIEQMKRLEHGELGDGTGIGTALASAINRLRDSKARSKVIILLTDGMSNVGELTPENAALAAKALGIKVYTVAAGIDGIVQVPVRGPFGGTQYVRQRSEIDETSLRRMADTTGALFFRATDLGGLNQVYAQIDSLEKTEVEVEQYTRYEERFGWFALIALALLSAEQVLAVGRLGRLP